MAHFKVVIFDSAKNAALSAPGIAKYYQGTAFDVTIPAKSDNRPAKMDLEGKSKLTATDKSTLSVENDSNTPIFAVVVTW